MPVSIKVRVEVSAICYDVGLFIQVSVNDLKDAYLYLVMWSRVDSAICRFEGVYRL